MNLVARKRRRGVLQLDYILRLRNAVLNKKLHWVPPRTLRVEPVTVARNL